MVTLDTKGNRFGVEVEESVVAEIPKEGIYVTPTEALVGWDVPHVEHVLLVATGACSQEVLTIRYRETLALCFG